MFREEDRAIGADRAMLPQTTFFGALEKAVASMI